MAEKQNTFNSKNSALLTRSGSSKKLHSSSNIISKKSVHRKSSVEELAEEGYIFGRLLGQGSYSKVK